MASMDGIDVTLIFHKQMVLETIAKTQMKVSLRVCECENPYALIFLVETGDGESCRLDITKNDIATHLRNWLEGEQIESSCYAATVAIEEEIMRYVKFGSPPKPLVLSQWLLSRCRLSEYPQLGISIGNVRHAASHGSTKTHDMESSEMDSKGGSVSKSNFAVSAVSKFTTIPPPDRDKFQPVLEKATVQTMKTMSSDAMRSREMTFRSKATSATSVALLAQEIMGRSVALDELHGKHTRRAAEDDRADARATVDMASLTEDHFRLGCEIERARKEVEQTLEERRRMIEVNKVRAQTLREKFAKGKEERKAQRGAGGWTKKAAEEVMTLLEIQQNIEDDMVRQRNRGLRAVQTVMWTLAPNGCNLGGKSLPGPVLGKGPLPPEATTRQKDPRVEDTMAQYYWDKAGRRHRKPKRDSDDKNIVEHAMAVIKRWSAASTSSAYKLNLKHVFREMDTSGDGQIVKSEMVEAFAQLGINLDLASIDALFNHFDPNGSGWINYGEFVWAFYNKKALMRQWKTATQNLTAAQIMNKFNDADTNGDGVLGLKEFTKFLKFGMKLKLSTDDIETLLDKFDHDKDGTLDLTEFSEFMEEELQKFNADAETLRSNKAPPPPKKKLVYRPMTHTTRARRMADTRTLDAPPDYDELPPDYEAGGDGEEAAVTVRASLNDLPSSSKQDSAASLHHTTPGKLQGNSTISYSTRPKSATAASTHRKSTAGASKDLRSSTTDQLPPQAKRDRGGVIGPPTGTTGKEKVAARSMVNNFSATGTTLADGTSDVMVSTLGSTVSTDSVLWVNEILQKQADIESKLGHSYF